MINAEKVKDLRADHEIEHGKRLADADAEYLWGWETPAGRLRAERRAALIASGAGLRPGMRVLEIGCGTGVFTEKFAQTGAHIVAVDISPDLLDKARKRNLPPHRVQFIQKRFEDCTTDGPFDAVIGSSVLHHLDIDTALHGIYDLLKSGCNMSFAEPNMLNPQVFAERAFRGRFPHISPDETAFIRYRLRSLLTRAGFERVSITPFDWLHPATPGPLIGLVGRLGGILEIIPVLREFSGSLLIEAMK